jgi:hypothetical protein
MEMAELTAPESNLQARIYALEREVDVLRRFGNKACTAMADEELQNTTPQAPLETPGEATPARVVPDAIWNDAIEAAAKINNKHAEKMEREAERAYVNNELDEISAIRSAAWKLQVAGDEIRSLKKGSA